MARVHTHIPAAAISVDVTVQRGRKVDFYRVFKSIIFDENALRNLKNAGFYGIPLIWAVKFFEVAKSQKA